MIQLLFIFPLIAASLKSDNWAVIVDTSRFWFNYRHAANSLSVYRSVKRLGIPDSHIILMMADDFACNARNPFPGSIFNNRQHQLDVYGDNVEVDYRGEDVTVHNVIRVLTDRLVEGSPNGKRLDTNENSNILIYMTGHGGEDFIKFQEQEELTSHELADALEQMHIAKRYNEILLVVDTCQAATLYSKIYSPNIIAISSSLKGEDSLSHHADTASGVFVIDRFTYYLLNFLETIEQGDTSKTMTDLFKICPKHQCISTANHQVFDFQRDVNKVPVVDFFSGVRKIKRTEIISFEGFKADPKASYPKYEKTVQTDEVEFKRGTWVWYRLMWQNHWVNVKNTVRRTAGITEALFSVLIICIAITTSTLLSSRKVD